MLRKLLLVTFLFPFVIILFIVATTLFFGKSLYIDDYLIFSIILASTLVIAFSYKLKLIKFDTFKLNLREFIVAFLASGLLFFIFYIQRVHFGQYTKEPFSLLSSIMTFVLIPVVEEIFNKKVILDNLEKLKVNKFLVISLPIFYFTVLHYPHILFIHFLVGITTTIIYYKNRNILQVILIHAIYNFSIAIYNYL